MALAFGYERRRRGRGGCCACEQVRLLCFGTFGRAAPVHNGLCSTPRRQVGKGMESGWELLTSRCTAKNEMSAAGGGGEKSMTAKTRMKIYACSSYHSPLALEPPTPPAFRQSSPIASFVSFSFAIPISWLLHALLAKEGEEN